MIESEKTAKIFNPEVSNVFKVTEEKLQKFVSIDESIRNSVPDV